MASKKNKKALMKMAGIEASSDLLKKEPELKGTLEENLKEIRRINSGAVAVATYAHWCIGKLVEGMEAAKSRVEKDKDGNEKTVRPYGTNIKQKVAAELNWVTRTVIRCQHFYVAYKDAGEKVRAL